MTKLFKEIFRERKMIFNLAINDFLKRYANSYFGIIWAFVQPIMTILVFWFVFQVGFKNPPIQDIPFIVWFITGLIPWFFFQDATLSATNCFFEYNFLVKKVLFKISILPIVKILSSLFVHVVFLGFMFAIYSLYDIKFSMYAFQIIYYLLCMIFYILGLSFITSSIVLFFTDTIQILAIVMQFGMWLTPIMWSYTIMPDKYSWVFNLNPMYYVVQGYRDSLINHIWFWDKPIAAMYFWGLTVLYFIIGVVVYQKLKPHFSDVL